MAEIKRKGVTPVVGSKQTLHSGGSATSGGWEDPPTEVERRSYTALIYGDTGTGRTRLALTAPGPIALAHTAEKIDGIVQREMAGGKSIKVHNFGTVATGTNQEISNQVKPVWDRFVNRWNEAVDTWARTVICDTSTEAWEIIRLAFFGELNPKGRTTSLYGPVNQRWKSVFKRNKVDWRCNIITIARTKDEYKDVIKNGQKVSEATGRTIYVGQKDMMFDADVVIRTGKYIDRERGLVFTAEIQKAWFNADFEGAVFENEEANMPYIMEVITGIDKSEWSV